MKELKGKARELLMQAMEGEQRVVVVSGAGISAESGIPTFRGVEGYWQVGSKNYHPHELATLSAFRRQPREVWSWYLYRRGVCLRAEPNAAHHALVRLEQHLNERFTLVTQNVDGLHGRAGASREQTYEVHGNIRFMRFDDVGELDPRLIPEELSTDWARGRQVHDDEINYLRHACGVLGRPHVLWFDEYYDETRFRYDSTLRAAEAADLLLVVGSSGTTNLPVQVAERVSERNIPFIVVNKDVDSYFVDLAQHSQTGAVLIGNASEWIPVVVDQLIKAM
ncbi:MAG: RNA polymerase subunit sigma [Myxococcales bacterium]|nr:RNA polymerase subunit sigma [Myxococcales bacterium]